MHNLEYEYTDLAAGYTNAMDHLGDGREDALESMDIFGLANFLDRKPRRVVILTGAGVSVNAGKTTHCVFPMMKKWFQILRSRQHGLLPSDPIPVFKKTKCNTIVAKTKM